MERTSKCLVLLSCFYWALSLHDYFSQNNWGRALLFYILLLKKDAKLPLRLVFKKLNEI